MFSQVIHELLTILMCHIMRYSRFYGQRSGLSATAISADI